MFVSFAQGFILDNHDVTDEFSLRANSVAIARLAAASASLIFTGPDSD